MPGKSRRSKRKHSFQGKRKRSGHGSLAISARQMPVSQDYEPVSKPEVSAPSPAVPTPTTAVATLRYPYITSELRRIGILTGIILVILVVLALVLS